MLWAQVLLLVAWVMVTIARAVSADDAPDAVGVVIIRCVGLLFLFLAGGLSHIIGSP